MTSRILPREEWHRLKGTELARVTTQAAERNAPMYVLVVEDGGEIVGCWSLFQVWHAEGLWIAPAHRGKSAVARHLWRLGRRVAEMMGFVGVMTAANQPEVEHILRGSAVELPGKHYLLPLLCDEKESEDACLLQ